MTRVATHRVFLSAAAAEQWLQESHDTPQGKVSQALRLSGGFVLFPVSKACSVLSNFPGFLNPRT